MAILFDDTADAYSGNNIGYNMWIGGQQVTKYVANGQTLTQANGNTAIISTGTYKVDYDAAGNIISMTQVVYGTTPGFVTLAASYCDGTVIRNDTASTASAYYCSGMNIYIVHSVSKTVTAGTTADVANATTPVNNYMVLNAAGQVTTTFVVVAD